MFTQRTVDIACKQAPTTHDSLLGCHKPYANLLQTRDLHSLVRSMFTEKLPYCRATAIRLKKASPL